MPGGGAGWLAAHPALADRSSWREDIAAAARPDERQLGPVGIGNGKVFGILGDGYPLATWHNLGGPTYHRPIKWFSDETPYVVAEGARRVATHESISYVRRAPVAIVESGDDELDWSLVAFAPRGAVSPGADQALVSVWIVRNRSPRTIADVGLEIDGFLSRYDGAGLAESDTGDRRVLVRPIDPSAEAALTPSGDKGITFPIGELRPGEERVIPIANAFVQGGASPQPILDALASDGVDALLDATLAWWRDWFRSAASVETPDPAFDDLFDALVLSIKVNQAATGALSEMSEYAYTWLRDDHGPAIFYPRVGLAADFRDMLDYAYGAAVLNGDISNALPADSDLSSLPPAPDWRSLPQFTWRTRAESPSFLVLEYEAYERATGDSSRAAQRFDLLYHALFQQQFVDGCLQYYSGDETFEDTKQASFGQNPLTEPDESTLSAYSSFAMIRASRYLSDLATRLGRADDAARLAQLASDVQRCLDQVFWIPDPGHYAIEASTATRVPDPRPYEDVSTMPLWLDVLDAADPKAVANFEYLLATLGQPNGTIVSKLPNAFQLLFTRVNLGVQTGMSHGYWLVNLDKMFHPVADEAFRRWRDVVTPTGFTEEALIADDYSHLQVIREPIGIVCDVSARYRSWESGIIGNALLTHLTGYDLDVLGGTVRLAPHLPPEWDHDTWHGLSYGEGRFALNVSRRGSGGREIVITTDAAASFRLDLAVPVDGTFQQATVNGATAAAAAARNRYGTTVVTFDPLTIPAGQTTTVDIDAS